MNIFDSYIDAGQILPVNEREPFYRALIEYLHYGYEPDYLDGGSLAVFTAIFPSLELSRIRAQAGRKGGLSNSSIDVEASQEANGQANREASQEANGQAKSKSNSSKKEVPKGTSKEVERFQKPTTEEVSEYAKSIGYSLDAQSFIDYYESVGWMVGKKRMKDWKACVRTWKRRNSPAKEVKADVGAYFDYL